MVWVAAAISLAATDPAEEGKKIITAMLLVGLAFVALIAIGELFAWRRRRQYFDLLRRVRGDRLPR